MDALWALGRAHVDRVVLDEQVLALDQLDAHLLGEERVLEVRRVVGARRQHGHGRRLLARGRERVEILEQQVGVMLDRPDRLRREELGKEPHHHLAVLEHVRHARRHAQVVLEHVVLALVCTNDVHAGDVRIDATGNVHPVHLGTVLGVAEHALARDDAGRQDRLVVVDVVQERVQRVHALAQSPIEHLPLVGRNDARNDVERNQALGAGLLAVDREGDPDAMERALGLLALLGDAGGGCPAEPPRECLVMGPHPAIRGLHFIVRGAGHGKFPRGAQPIENPIAIPRPSGKSVRR